jgi:hypothetical protein
MSTLKVLDCSAPELLLESLRYCKSFKGIVIVPETLTSESLIELDRASCFENSIHVVTFENLCEVLELLEFLIGDGERGKIFCIGFASALGGSSSQICLFVALICELEVEFIESVNCENVECVLFLKRICA